MKKYLILVLISAALVFSSCSSLPEQKNSDDVLVVGSFILDYPDGFFEMPSRKIKSNVKLKIINTRTKEEINKVTRNGYFHLVAKPGDEFHISHYEHKTKENNGIYTVGGWVKRNFTVVENSVNYLGHMKNTSRAGEKSKQIGSDKYYSYKETFSVKDNNAEALDYYKFNNPDSTWFDNGLELIQLY